MTLQYCLRLATLSDVPVLNALISRSIRALGAADYSSAQIDAALQGAFGVDTMLIRDGTYFAVQSTAGEMIACGGWSRRHKLFGSDAGAERDESWLDPELAAAKIRAFFVDPAYARRGIGRAILEHSETAARGAGFSSFELMATLPGTRLYEACGYVAQPAIDYQLAGGVSIRFVPMRKQDVIPT